MFGNSTSKEIQNVVFRENLNQTIPVAFETRDFYFKKAPEYYSDPSDRWFKVTFDIGIIDRQY